MSTPALKTRDQIATVQDLLVKSKSQIQMALPSHLTADRMVRVALTTIRQTPKLLDCNPLSLVKCVMQAAALGLEPDPLMGRAYIVPYGTEATLIVGYKGLIDLARRSGQIRSVEAHVVYEHDEFSYSYGLSEDLVHKPAYQQDRGHVTHAWALARFKDGGHQFEVMDFWSLEKIRNGSKNGSGQVWRDHREEMYRKTVLRRLCKFLPLSPELSTHLGREELVDAGVAPSVAYEDDNGEILESPAPPSPNGSKSDALAAKLGREPGAEG